MNGHNEDKGIGMTLPYKNTYFFITFVMNV